MRFGKDAEALAEMHEAGMEVPAMENKPSVLGYAWLWEAFHEISTCRSFTMGGLGPIPWTAVQTYAEANRFSTEETYLLHRVVRHLDLLFLEHTRKK